MSETELRRSGEKKKKEVVAKRDTKRPINEVKMESKVIKTQLGQAQTSKWFIQKYSNYSKSIKTNQEKV